MKAIFFDLDETLLDTSGCRPPAVEASFRVAAQKYPQLDLESWREASEIVKKEMHDLWLNSPDSGTELLREGSYRILKRLGIDDRDFALQVSQAYYQTWVSYLKLFPEVREVLAALRGRVRLGMISNGPSDVQRYKLKLFELEREFDPIVISGEVGVAKPDPGIFRYALERARVSPSEALYVGDSPMYDIAGAKGAGMKMIWVNRNGLPTENLEIKPDRVVRDLRQLLAILRARSVVNQTWGTLRVPPEIVQEVLKEEPELFDEDEQHS
ncbi:MAG: HAD family hydrolase [Candidatus Bipolaricaulota bacterium]|nr:HAD family hydrolase [Candidatus Bipolaricaulota bacterium]MCS7275320.1 HAD family hydrolase [Candidatus Bipolaricaulota bacterium]MDW8110181.1 HAD family hydrolase [Candidatus Bipolaricaulota bacterium]MDW8329213.1 HAD family hydrolase [Candidatus Bipolaricaulota bacterium]